MAKPPRDSQEIRLIDQLATKTAKRADGLERRLERLEEWRTTKASPDLKVLQDHVADLLRRTPRR